MEQRSHSGLGISSFITSIASAGLVLVMFVVAGILEASTPGGMPEDSPAAMGIGCSVFVFLVGSLVSLGLGIGALFQQNRHKVFPILGIVISALTLFGTILLMLIGLAVG
jgi:hypothetical protein